MSTIENITITLVYVHEGETEENLFTTIVQLGESDPYTDVYDTAAERLYAKVPNAEIVYEELFFIGI